MLNKIHSSKNFLIIVLFFLLLQTNLGFGQSTANYTFSTVNTGSLENMSSGTTDLLATGSYRDDAASTVTNIGFDFVFMGSMYNQFSINSNGQMRLGSTVITQNPIFGAASNIPYIIPISHDNAILSTGKVHYKIIGSTPNRKLIVEWKDLRIPAGSTGAASLIQVILNETTGVIEYKYGRMFNNSTSSITSYVYISSSSGLNNNGTVSAITTTPAYGTTSTQTSNTFASNANITNLNSAADGSRRVFTFTPAATIPNTPLNLTYTNLSQSNITLNWTDNATNEAKYNIQSSTDGINYNTLVTLSANSTSYSISGLTANTTYYFRIYACSEGRVSSALSGSQATCLAQPTLSSATLINTSGFTASWGTIAGATSYSLEVSENSSFSSYVSGYPKNVGNVTSYAITGLTSGTTYYYRVTAIGGGCNSVVSSSNNTTLTCAAPTILASSITLIPAVNTISGSFMNGSMVSPSGYMVVRTTTNVQPSPINGTTYTTGANAIGYIEYVGSSVSSWNSIGLNASTTYYYWIFSYNNTNCQNGPVYSTTATNASVTTNACMAYSGTISVGPTGTFKTITTALSSLQSCSYTGDIILELQPTYTSTSEVYPINFTSALNTNASKTITIRPTSGVTGLTIESNDINKTFNFEGCQYIKIDGRPGGIGTNKELIISNTNTVGSAIHFINDASNNTFKYCKIKSTNVSNTSGTIVFGTSTLTSGNDNNAIEYCDIYDGSSTPKNAIYAKGTMNKDNNNNTIANCNIYNFFNATADHCGIKVEDYNSDWTINNNSFYETTTRDITSSGIEWNAISLNHALISNFTINNNYIGGQSANCGGSAMTITGSGVIRAIKLMNVSPTNACNVNGNTFKNISFTTSSNSTVHSLIFINTGSANIGSTSGNTLGDATNPINFTYSGTLSTGIYAAISLGNTGTLGSINISNNLVNNLNVNNSSTGNIIFRGISLSGSATSLTVSKNNIFNLTHLYSGGTATNIAGIYSNSTTNNARIEKNFIYNLNLNTTNIATSYIYGIQLSNSNTTICSNNMVRLGYKADGSQITIGYKINGIYENTGYNTIANNSIYIGGTISSGGSDNTFALNASTTVNTRIYQNNILVNQRTGGTSGIHAAIYLGGTSGLTCDYNIYHTVCSGNNYLAQISGNHLTLQSLRYTIRAVNGDLHSAFANPNFVNPTALTPDLHVTGTTPAEASGIAIANITDDYDGDLRSSNSPTDIGADAGNYTANDKFTPNISYTPFTNGAGTCNRTLTATITDIGTGISTTNKPCILYKKNTTGSWNIAEGTLASGNEFNGTWSFVIDYTPILPFVSGDKIYYYVVAQDNATTPNTWYTAFDATTPLHSNVATQTTPPADISTNNFTIVPTYAGTYNIPNATYTTLTANAATGFFKALNEGVVTGNITVNLVSDITENGAIALNQWIEDCGTGFTLTIQSSGGTRIINGTLASPTPLVKINRADNVTINGVNIANNGTAPAIEITDGSKNILITNCDIKSNNTANGVIYISPHAIANDGPNINITNNNIHNYTSGSANSLIYINNNYADQTLISNNNLFDFKTTAIYINAHGSRKFTISNNNIYNTVTTSTGNYSGMYLVSGDSIEINGNNIGGQASNCGGSAWLNSSNIDFNGIKIVNNSATMKYCEIKNNIIKNITQSGNASFAGVYVDNSNFLNNLIEKNIVSDITTNSTSITYIRGIHVKKGANVRKNKVYNLNGTTTTSTFTRIIGIDYDNTVTDINNNDISNNMIYLNGGTVDHFVYGINSNTRTTSTLNTFYNTVYITGTIATSQSNNTACFNRIVESTENVKNNIFINTITGNSNNFCIKTKSTGLELHNSNYNLLIAPTVNQIANDGSTKDFATWVNTGKDKSSWTASTGLSTNYNTINLSNLFIDATNGDLRINNANPEAWYIFGKGVAGTQTFSISEDFENNTRSSTYGLATCIGASQCSTPTVDPIVANQNGSLTAGNTTSYIFGGRTICSIDWAAASNVPTSMEVKYFSGINPPNPQPASAKYNNYYVKATATGGTIPFNYTMNLSYDEAFQGTFNTLINARIAKYDYESDSWTTYMTANNNFATASNPYIIRVVGLTSFSGFTGADFANPLPVEMLNYNGKCINGNAIIEWETASEINNDYFTIEKSENLIDWLLISKIKSIGNSTVYQQYSVIDKNINNKLTYYKIKQTDFNGKFATYNPIVVECNKNIENKAGIEIFPNPAKNNLNILLPKSKNISKFNIEIFNNIGNKVLEINKTNVSTDQNVEIIDISTLSLGVYILHVTTDELYRSVKVIKE